MGVGHPRAGGEAKAYAEETLAHAVGVARGVLVDGLAVHRLPQGARLDAGGVEGEAHGLDVGVGLEVGVGRLAGMGHTCGTAHGAGDDFGIGSSWPFTRSSGERVAVHSQ